MGSRKILSKTKLEFIENIVIIEKLIKMLAHQFFKNLFIYYIIKKWDDVLVIQSSLFCILILPDFHDRRGYT